MRKIELSAARQTFSEVHGKCKCGKNGDILDKYTVVDSNRSGSNAVRRKFSQVSRTSALRDTTE